MEVVSVKIENAWWEVDFQVDLKQCRFNCSALDVALTSPRVCCCCCCREVSEDEVAVMKMDRGGAAGCCVLCEHRQPLHAALDEP